MDKIVAKKTQIMQIQLMDNRNLNNKIPREFSNSKANPSKLKKIRVCLDNNKQSKIKPLQLIAKRKSKIKRLKRETSMTSLKKLIQQVQKKQLKNSLLSSIN